MAAEYYSSKQNFNLEARKGDKYSTFNKFLLKHEKYQFNSLKMELIELSEVEYLA
jgi:hypothetical protein